MSVQAQAAIDEFRRLADTVDALDKEWRLPFLFAVAVKKTYGVDGFDMLAKLAEEAAEIAEADPDDFAGDAEVYWDDVYAHTSLEAALTLAIAEGVNVKGSKGRKIVVATIRNLSRWHPEFHIYQGTLASLLTKHGVKRSQSQVSSDVRFAINKGWLICTDQRYVPGKRGKMYQWVGN